MLVRSTLAYLPTLKGCDAHLSGHRTFAPVSFVWLERLADATLAGQCQAVDRTTQKATERFFFI